MEKALKEIFFRLDGAWASFELTAVRKREDYLKPFRVLRCKIDDQVDLEAPSGSALHFDKLSAVSRVEPSAAADGFVP